MSRLVWLVRPRPQGGCDSVNVQHDLDGCAPGTTEIRLGSYLPLQTPLLKHRQRLPLAEAERCLRWYGFSGQPPSLTSEAG
jgi:hypothetical protein